MTSKNGLDSKTASNIALWLDGHYDEKTKESVRQLVKDNPQAATDCFYTNLSFGTSGMRGLMGVGTNRINAYTVRAATQGIANYVNRQPSPPEGHSAFIGFDSRNNSKTFAHEAAKVFAANGIKVYLFKDLRPTPLVSFGCRLKKCTTAIMITASHNPAAYNGYKVYWSDGGQVLSPHDTEIMQEVEKIIDPRMVKTVLSLDDPMITIVSEEIDAAYLDAAKSLQFNPEVNKLHGKDLKIVYTNLHGAGITITPRMLTEWGFSDISVVDSQAVPDGDFPTVNNPNPEARSALAVGIEQLEEIQGDILIAHDPDADRVGVVALHHEEAVQLNGNQVAVLCLEYICDSLSNQSKLPENAAFIKTMVTTELFKRICDHYQRPCFNVVTGFKHIAKMIREWEMDPQGPQYIFGAEESCGYLYGTLTRDKDAVIISGLLCEMALEAKREGKTLVDLLHELYRKYGIFVEKADSVHFEEGKSGREKMAQSMLALRKSPPSQINGVGVKVVEDDLPKSDVVVIWLEDGSKLIIRPSGTEPKIKLHVGVECKECAGSMEESLKLCQEKAERLLTALKGIVTQE